MRRFYYTDPLAAAWMENKFDMKFIDLNGGDIWICEANYMYGENEQVDRSYIHPDSMHLLEPKERDLVDGWAGRIGFVEEREDEEDITDGFTINVHGGSWECPRESQGRTLQYEIIQRNGIAFHWPESEEV